MNCENYIHQHAGRSMVSKRLVHWWLSAGICKILSAESMAPPHVLPLSIHAFITLCVSGGVVYLETKRCLLSFTTHYSLP